MFSGSYVAIVTPWNDDCSQVDFDCLEELIEFQIENGTDGIVPCGTTGESATLTHSEQMDVVRCTVETVAGRCKVVAGAGSNATAEAVQLSVHAKNVGADGILVITPYYNKPTPDGLVAHFAAVAEAFGAVGMTVKTKEEVEATADVLFERLRRANMRWK